ncbi:MAG: hypothetical protein BPHS0_10 [Phage 5P_3]|nr:MAG: hypothetical protein BPHS0_10 [Phage 5P_3]
MAATAAQRAQLRRMVNEPTTIIYSDDVLDDYIERYPLVDDAGLGSDETGWVAAYDLYAAAADIMYEKAATAAAKVDFGADGGQFSLSQQQRAYLLLAEQYRGQSRGQVRGMVE